MSHEKCDTFHSDEPGVFAQSRAVIARSWSLFPSAQPAGAPKRTRGLRVGAGLEFKAGGGGQFDLSNVINLEGTRAP